jgi:hypothetical protein
MIYNRILYVLTNVKNTQLDYILENKEEGKTNLSTPIF